MDTPDDPERLARQDRLRRQEQLAPSLARLIAEARRASLPEVDWTITRSSDILVRVPPVLDARLTRADCYAAQLSAYEEWLAALPDADHHDTHYESLRETDRRAYTPNAFGTGLPLLVIATFRHLSG